MRYGMTILVAVALLAMTVMGYAAEINWRQGGGTYAGVDWTDVKCDDAVMLVRNKTYVPNGIGYGYVRARFGSSYESTVVMGWAEMFTLVPPTSGGGNIVIDNAIITFTSEQTHSDVPPLSLYRMTTPWLNGTPGAIDNDVCFAYKQASTTTTWSAGDFSTADYTTTNGVSFPWADGNANQKHPATVTQLMQDIYDSGVNAGLFLIQDDNALNDSAAKPGLSEAGSSEWIYYANGQPTLHMEYHYETPIPEPGTMVLLGTGALGVIGYLKRKRIQ